MMNVKYRVVALMLVCMASVHAEQSFVQRSFADKWHDMQQQYRLLVAQESQPQYYARTQNLYHSFWQGVRKEMRSFLLGAPQPYFLTNKNVLNTMFRVNDNGAGAQFEITYLTYCVDAAMRDKIFHFKDTDFGTSYPRSCKEFQCNYTTLGHLFYAAKVLQQAPQPIKSIVEFGAGFGSLARIFKKLVPEATIICIDMPESIGLQYLYLKEVCPETRIIVHTEIPASYEEKAIHLMPVFLIEDMEFTSDIFISTFALSESPEYTQDLMFKKKLFNARFAYLTGQIGSERHGLFARHDKIHQGMRDLYKRTSIIPYHLNFGASVGENMPSYEAIGQ